MSEYIDQLPSPVAIHARMGQISRELTLLRRLLRLSQAAREARKLDQAKAADLDTTLSSLHALRREVPQ